MVEFPCREIQELWLCSFGNSKFVYHPSLILKMHRIVPASPLFALSTNLVASIDCLSAWYQVKIILTILIWRIGTRTSLTSLPPETWLRQHQSRCRSLVGNRQFSCYLRFRNCGCSFGNISSFTIQHIVKMDRIGTSITLVTGFICTSDTATVTIVYQHDTKWSSDHLYLTKLDSRTSWTATTWKRGLRQHQSH